MNLSNFTNTSFTTRLSLSEELRFEQNKNYLFELSSFSLLDLSGNDVSTFLQGQLTCDLRQVTQSAIRQGAVCNVQGRVITLVDVVQWQGFHLLLPTELIKETKKSLATAALFSRINLNINTDYLIYGFYLQNQNDIIPLDLNLPIEHYGLFGTENRCCYHLGEQFYIIIVKKEKQQTFTNLFIKYQQFRGSLGWHQQQLKRKHPFIYSHTSQLFLPHRLGLDLLDYLSFDKGCYKGQEIIARMHYRAKSKHHIQLVTTKTLSKSPMELALLPGQKLFSKETQQEVGEIIDQSPLGNNDYLIAVSALKDYGLSQALTENQELVSFLPYAQHKEIS